MADLVPDYSLDGDKDFLARTSAALAKLTNPNAQGDTPPSPEPDFSLAGDQEFLARTLGQTAPATPTAAPPTSTGAFLRGAGRGILPSLGAMGGLGAGAELGALVGGGTPAEVVTVPVGALGGAFLGAEGVGKLQEKALNLLPDWLRNSLGQGQEQQQADIAGHPIASFLGELAPQLATLRPGRVLAAPAGASALQKLMSKPVVARGISAGVAAAQQYAGNEMTGQPTDPKDIAIAAALGALLNKETKLGAKVSGAGARLVRAPVEALTRGAGPAAEPPPDQTPPVETPLPPAPGSVKVSRETAINNGADLGNLPIPQTMQPVPQGAAGAEGRLLPEVPGGLPKEVAPGDGQAPPQIAQPAPNGELAVGQSLDGRSGTAAIEPPQPPAPAIAPGGEAAPAGDGTRAAPLKITAPGHVELASENVNTAPSEAQKLAGNYQKSHVQLHGLDISIENPKGSERSGVDANGKPWAVQMPSAYGYIKRTMGADGDQVDTYIGDHPNSNRVFVVDQKDAETGKFDENKAFLGFRSEPEVRETYLKAFSDNRGAERIGGLREMSIDDFKQQLNKGAFSKAPKGFKTTPAQIANERALETARTSADAANAVAAKLPPTEPEKIAAYKARDERIGENWAKQSQVKFGRAPTQQAVQAATLSIAQALDKGVYSEHFRPDNTISRGVFEQETGTKLPKTIQGTKEFLHGQSWLAPTKENAAPASTSGAEVDQQGAVQVPPASSAVLAPAASAPLAEAQAPITVQSEIGSAAGPKINAAESLPSEKPPTPPLSALKSNIDPRTGKRPLGNAALKDMRGTMKLIVQNEKGPLTAKTLPSRAAVGNEGSFLSTVQGLGGIRTKDSAGNLTKEGQDVREALKDYQRPGLINDSSGRNPDDMRSWFEENGWFAGSHDQGQGMDNLYEALRSEANGSKVYHPSKELLNDAPYDESAHEHFLDGRAHALGITRDPNWSTSDYAAAVTEREAMMNEHELSPDIIDDHERQIQKQFDALRDSIDPLDRWAVRHDIARTTRATGPGQELQAPRPAPASGEGAGTAAGPSPEAERAAPPANQRGENAPAQAPFATEAGAVDAQNKRLPQTVIPGAERISEGANLKRKSETPLRGTPGQKSTEGLGLFSPEAAMKAKEEEPGLFEQAQRPKVEDRTTSTLAHYFNEDRSGWARDQTPRPVHVVIDAAGRPIDWTVGNRRRAEASRQYNPDDGHRIIKLTQKDFGAAKGDVAAAVSKANEEEHGLFETKGIAEERAPVFYSALDRGVENLKQGKAPAEQWLNTIKNLPGVKQEERDWIGLDDWLKDQKGTVTKGQVLDFIRANNIEVKEVEKGGARDVSNLFPEDIEDWTDSGEGQDYSDGTKRTSILKSGDAVATVRFNKLGEVVGVEAYYKDNGPAKFRDFIEAREWLIRQSGEEPSAGTKFSTYTLPGGENYRELLLTLPVKPSETAMWQAQQLAKRKTGRSWEQLSEAEREKLIDPALTASFRSGHFDEPNVLAHVRFNDRVDGAGKRTLFIEELQSDWHQKGRRRGYAEVEPKTTPRIEPADLRIESGELDWRGIAPDGRHLRVGKGTVETEAEARDYIARYMNQNAARDNMERLEAHRAKVPDAPFKTSWPELAMKRMLRYAAENGYDQVAWTTGEQQAARYDLSKHISRLVVERLDDGRFKIEMFDKRGQAHGFPTAVAEADLPDHVGKDLAEKIVSDIKKPGGKTYSGLDLKVGGEGMKGFYDQILPSFLNKYSKKWGAQVGETRIGTAPKGTKLEIERQRDGGWSVYEPGRPAQQQVFETEDEARDYARTKQTELPTTVHAMPITPAMRESVMAGQALFQGEKKNVAVARSVRNEVPAAFKNSKTHSEALRSISDLLTKRGEDTGHETASLYNPETGDLSHLITSDDTSAVRFSDEVQAAVRNPDNRFVLQHNHPMNGSLSGGDITALANPGVEWIVAHSKDGSAYAARLTPDIAQASNIGEGAPSGTKRSAAVMGMQLRHVTDEARRLTALSMFQAIRDGKIGADEAVDSFYHAMSVALQKAGVIDYRSTKPVTPIINRVAEESRHGIVKALRRVNLAPAHALRPAAAAVQRSGSKSAGDLLDEIGGHAERPPSASRDRADEGRARPVGEGQGPDTIAQGEGARFDEKPPLDEIKESNEPLGGGIASHAEAGKVSPGDGGSFDNISDAISSEIKDKGPSTQARDLFRIYPAGITKTKFLNVAETQGLLPRTLSAQDTRFSKLWNAVRLKDDKRNSTAADLRGDIKSYLDLSPAERKKLYAYEELRMMHQGVVSDAIDEKNFSAENKGIAGIGALLDQAAYSKPGDKIMLDTPQLKEAEQERRAMFDRAWTEVIKSSAKKLGWHGEADSAVMLKKAESMAHGADRTRTIRNASLIAMMESQRQDAYIPRMRFGDYYLAIRPKSGTEKDSLGGYPSLTRFELVESRNTLDRIMGQGPQPGQLPKNAAQRIAELRKQFPESKYNIEHGYMFNKGDSLKKLDIPAIEKFLALVGNDVQGKVEETLPADMSPAEKAKTAQSLFDDLVDKVRDQMYEEMKAGFKKRAKTVPGYEGDFDRTTGAYINWISGHVAHLEHGDAIQQAKVDYVDAHPDPEVRKYADHWLRSLNERPSALDAGARAARQAAFLYTLAGNAASTAKILLHAPMLGGPLLGAATGHGKAMGALLNAMRESAAQIRIDRKEGLTIAVESLGHNAEEKALLKDLSAKGSLHQAGAEEIAAMSRHGEAAQAGPQKFWRRAMAILSSNIAAADIANRASMALAAFRLAKNPAIMAKIEKVWGENESFKRMVESEGLTPSTFARFMVDQANGIWGSRGRMPVARNWLGSTAVQFKNFEVNYLSNMNMLMRRMGPEGKLAATMMLGGLGALGGVAALPFSQDIEGAAQWMYGMVTGINPDIDADLAQFAEDEGLSKASAEMVLHGPSRALGLDLGSLGFGDVIGQNTMSPLDVFPSVSIFAGAAQRAYQRYQSGQEPSAVVAEGLPNAVKNVVLGLDVYPKQGIETPSGNQILTAGQITSGMGAMKALGFTSSDVSRAYEERNRQFDLTSAWKGATSALEQKAANLTVRAMHARATGDEAGAASIEAERRQAILDGVHKGAIGNIRSFSVAVMQHVIQHTAPEASAIKKAPRALRGEVATSPLMKPPAGGPRPSGAAPTPSTTSPTNGKSAALPDLQPFYAAIESKDPAKLADLSRSGMSWTRQQAVLGAKKAGLPATANLLAEAAFPVRPEIARLA